MRARSHAPVSPMQNEPPVNHNAELPDTEDRLQDGVQDGLPSSTQGAQLNNASAEACSLVDPPAKQPGEAQEYCGREPPDVDDTGAADETNARHAVKVRLIFL